MSDWYFGNLENSNSLYHHGILGQKWGVRNGPPYPLKGGSVTKEDKKRNSNLATRVFKNKEYKKKYVDEILKADKSTLSTLSYDPDRTKNTDMFYATHKKLDKHQYNALFNKPIPQTQYDSNGKSIGTGMGYKYRIDNKLKTDIKVASEESGAKAFASLYQRDRNFYNFVTDQNRMQKYFVDDKYKFKGYRETRSVLEKMRNTPDYTPTSKDVKTLYRMFNYVLPYDGQGNEREKNDVLKNRAMFFNELKNRGYGAVLDTNDAIYGGFKATSPVVVFDMDKVVLDKIHQTTKNEKRLSEVVLVGRRALGI